MEPIVNDTTPARLHGVTMRAAGGLGISLARG
jgi:hypothetical protein